MDNWSALYYDADDLILITSPLEKELASCLAAHETGNSLLNAGNVSSHLADLSGAENVFYEKHKCPNNPNVRLSGGNMEEEEMMLKSGDFQGVEIERLKQLGNPEYSFFGEFPGGKIVQSIEIPDVDIGEETERRTDILRQGRSYNSRQPLEQLYSNVSSTSSGSRVILRFEIPQYEDSRILRAVYQNDFPWCICTWDY